MRPRRILGDLARDLRDLALAGARRAAERAGLHRAAEWFPAAGQGGEFEQEVVAWARHADAVGELVDRHAGAGAPGGPVVLPPRPARVVLTDAARALGFTAAATPRVRLALLKAIGCVEELAGIEVALRGGAPDGAPIDGAAFAERARRQRNRMLHVRRSLVEVVEVLYPARIEDAARQLAARSAVPDAEVEPAERPGPRLRVVPPPLPKARRV